jgi:hypothetical protein
MTKVRWEAALSPPPVIYLCLRPSCRRGVVSFLGRGNETLFEPSVLRPHPWCYTCGNKDPQQIQRYRLDS